MEELVSIIMPSYNTGKYISKSIESVLRQTYSNWELIIVDDCSTDDTDTVVSGFLNDNRIIYIKNERNYGAALSRNMALRKATGKWIAFLDSDDLWKYNKLEKQVNFMKNNHYYFSYTYYSVIDEKGGLTGKLIEGPKYISKVGFYNYCWPGCLTVMFDRDYIGLIQIVDIKKNNDYAMWLKVCKKADCYLLADDLAFYRKGRSGSISTESFISLIKWHYILFRKSENQNIAISVINTIRNVFFGIIKKIIYVKRR